MKSDLHTLSVVWTKRYVQIYWQWHNIIGARAPDVGTDTEFKPKPWLPQIISSSI